MTFEPFKYKTADDLLKKAAALGVDLPFDEDLSPLFEPGSIKGKRIPNRMAVHPMEGYDSNPDGKPGELTHRRYKRYAQGGSGMIWFEATSIVPEGRSNPHQMMIIPETVGEVKDLVDATRKAAKEALGEQHNPYLVLQLTHSGRYSKPDGKLLNKAVCENPYLDLPDVEYQYFSDEEFDQLHEDFLRAAKLAQEAGFDAVDIKACHGYLLHELLQAQEDTNSYYQGPFIHRIKLLWMTCAKIDLKIPDIDVAVRLNVTDGIPYPYGFGTIMDDQATPNLHEPKELINILLDAGLVLLNVTAGVPYVVPHVGRPFDRPTKGAEEPPEHPLEGVNRFIQLNAEIQKAFPELPTVATGYSWLRQFWPNVASAVLKSGNAAYIGLGRGAFAYPDAPMDLINKGRLDKHKVCIACSRCTELIRALKPSGCVIRDRSVYRDIYRTLEANA